MADRGYTITKADRWTYLDELSNPVDGYRITFVYDDGMVDFVYVPERQYTPEQVHNLIQEKLAVHKELFAE